MNLKKNTKNKSNKHKLNHQIRNLSHDIWMNSYKINQKI
jgi:hypothetical protein